MAALEETLGNSVVDASSAPQTTENATNRPRQMAGGLRLIAHNEPGFEDHVSSTYPQIANHELYPKARKFMAVLSHEGSRQAKAYHVLWTIQQSPNRQRTMQAVYIQKHCMLRSAVLNVRPGKKRLVSMFFNYSTSDYNFRPDSATLRIPLNFPFLDAEVISVSVNAVIYSDRTIAGPDKYDLRTRYQAVRAAEHNEGYSLSWKLDKNAPYAAGIPGELRILFCPPAWDSPTVKAIEKDVRYRAFFFNPATGNEKLIGSVTADSDGNWRIPIFPVFQDWVVVIERA